MEAHAPKGQGTLRIYFLQQKVQEQEKTAQLILLVTEAWRTKATAHNQHLLLGDLRFSSVQVLRFWTLPSYCSRYYGQDLPGSHDAQSGDKCWVLHDHGCTDRERVWMQSWGSSVWQGEQRTKAVKSQLNFSETKGSSVTVVTSISELTATESLENFM